MTQDLRQAYGSLKTQLEANKDDVQQRFIHEKSLTQQKKQDAIRRAQEQWESEEHKRKLEKEVLKKRFAHEKFLMRKKYEELARIKQKLLEQK